MFNTFRHRARMLPLSHMKCFWTRLRSEVRQAAELCFLNMIPRFCTSIGCATFWERSVWRQEEEAEEYPLDPAHASDLFSVHFTVDIIIFQWAENHFSKTRFATTRSHRNHFGNSTTHLTVLASPRGVRSGSRWVCLNIWRAWHFAACWKKNIHNNVHSLWKKKTFYNGVHVFIFWNAKSQGSLNVHCWFYVLIKIKTKYVCIINRFWQKTSSVRSNWSAKTRLLISEISVFRRRENHGLWVV